jgi:hypothetical protein
MIQNMRSKRFTVGRGYFRFSTGDLLAKSEDFEGSIRAATEEHPYRGDQCKQQIQHKRPL